MDASETIQDVNIEEGGDSDAELEAAVVVEDDIKAEASDVPVHQVEISAIPADTTTIASGSTQAATSPFKLPPNPTIPQDLSIIMDMVANNEVVGSLPSVSMSAAEKRKLVEASLAKNREKGQEKESVENIKQETVEQLAVAGTGLSDESSSEFESSSEEESDSEEEGQEGSKPVDAKPMTSEEHTVLKKELDEFVNQGGAEVEMDSAVEDASDSDLDSDDEGDLSYPNLGAMGFEFMEDDEDDVGLSSGAAITSTHEAPLPPVALPPMEKLPEGEGVSLAGDVVSWMREKKVELWLEKKAKEEAEIKAETEAQASVKAEQGESEAKSETLGPSEAEGMDGQAEKEEGAAAMTKSVVGPSSTKKQTEPKFTSSGTVVVRAMQSRPGAADEGWLEEGSVLCWEDGRVLGTVHETFGPLTSPFYTIRLPPPPFPYPTPEQLNVGTRLFYPLSPSYRSFVNMLALRDPRLKGSDASNLYDEEIGEDEVEWSDDEAEAEAKKRRKQRRAGPKTPSLASGGNKGKDSVRGSGSGSEFAGGQGPAHGLPARPHFDYQPNDETAFSETGSMYGGDDEGDRWENMSVSDIGSTASTRGRPKPAPYDLEGDTSMEVQHSSESGGRGKGRGRGGRGGGGGGGGRGQGRDRGSGRGRGGRGRGGNAQAGGRNDSNAAGNQTTFPLPSNPMTMGMDMDMGSQLPMNPMMYQNQPQNYAQPQPQSQSPMHGGFPQQHQQFNSFPQHQQQFFPQPNYSYPQSQQNFQGYSPGQQHMGYPQSPQPQQQGYSNHSNNDAYEPHQPATGMPSASNNTAFQPQPIQQAFTPNQQSDNGNGSGVPAINPRFAAQYQQMMNMNMNMNMGMGMGMGINQQGWQGQGQGQNQNQNQNPYNQ
ncbi:hypothetical protein IAT40_003445 [Kwoniella sp. CBS 6097]